VSLKHHPNNPNYKSLTTSTHAHLWKRCDELRTLVLHTLDGLAQFTSVKF